MHVCLVWLSTLPWCHTDSSLFGVNCCRAAAHKMHSGSWFQALDQGLVVVLFISVEQTSSSKYSWGCCSCSNSMQLSCSFPQVPEMWSRVAYPSLKPLAGWIQDYHARVAFMRNWLANGPPACFWLPGFFFPQGFMTGVLQMHARKYSIPIDSLSFGFEVGLY